jgi:hypothetical protein
VKLFIGLVVSALFLLPLAAEAYLDPGTGSMLLQVILGGIAAVAVAIKLFWYRILAMFGIKKKAEEPTAGESSGQSDASADDGSQSGGGGWD